MPLNLRVNLISDQLVAKETEIGLFVGADVSEVAQFGGFAVANKAKKQYGLVVSALEELDGFQIGILMCSAPKKGNYFQIGLLTLRDSEHWYKRGSPIFGWHKEKDY